MRFDWYSGSIDRDPMDLIHVLNAGQDLTEIVQTSGDSYFRKGMNIMRGDRVISSVLFDNVQGSTKSHFRGTGLNAPDVASRIRSSFSDHEVTRVDVAEDFDDPGSFETLMHGLMPIADCFDIDVMHVGDWYRNLKGRTLYFGSRESVFCARLYEKGKQLGVNPNWVRFEIEVKPTGKARSRCARLKESEFFGCSSWGHHVGEYLNVSDLTRIPAGSLYNPSNLAKKAESMAKQYGATILGLLEECSGSESDLGRRIVQLVHDVRKAERKRRRLLRDHKNVH